jgi:hydrogenase expression/formation protein HypC
MTGATPEPAACSVTEGCITCGDVAVPLTVVAVTGADARCRDDAGREETVATELVGPVAAGDRVLVHAGVAIGRLTDDPAGEPAAQWTAQRQGR